MGLLPIPTLILILIFIFAAIATAGFMVYLGPRINSGQSENIREQELQEDVKSLEEELDQEKKRRRTVDNTKA